MVKTTLVAIGNDDKHYSTPRVESSDSQLTLNKRSTTTTPNTNHSDEHQHHNVTHNQWILSYVIPLRTMVTSLKMVVTIG